MLMLSNINLYTRQNMHSLRGNTRLQYAPAHMRYLGVASDFILVSSLVLNMSEGNVYAINLIVGTLNNCCNSVRC